MEAGKMESKLNKILIFILAFFVIFSAIPLAKAETSEDEIFDNVWIRLYGSGVNRVWDTTFVSVEISNFNDNMPVIIENLSILNSKNELILFEEVNFISYPVGKEKKTVDKVKSMYEEIISSRYEPIIVAFMVLYAPMWERANSKIKEHEFHKTFRDLDVYKFDPVLNENITVNLDIILRYGDKTTLRKANHSITMKQRLPAPLPETSLEDKARAEREETIEEKREPTKGWQGG